LVAIRGPLDAREGTRSWWYRRCQAAAWLSVSCGAAMAQPGQAPIHDASVPELRTMLLGSGNGSPPEGLITKGFRLTAAPDTNGLCPAADNAPESPRDTAGGIGASPPAQGATGRNLQAAAVPYTPDNPGVQMALRFAHDSDELGGDEQHLLDKLATAMNDPALTGRRFAVAGHTDATGGDKVNLPLSCARALAVKRYLVAQGVDGGRLSAYGFGSNRPLEPGVVRSARNRRVEVRTAGAQ
jgi:outer membrane protein OmpA-like peptidoglycan-associated protein